MTDEHGPDDPHHLDASVADVHAETAKVEATSVDLPDDITSTAVLNAAIESERHALVATSQADTQRQDFERLLRWFLALVAVVTVLALTMSVIGLVQTAGNRTVLQRIDRSDIQRMKVIADLEQFSEYALCADRVDAAFRDALTVFVSGAVSRDPATIEHALSLLRRRPRVVTSCEPLLTNLSPKVKREIADLARPAQSTSTPENVIPTTTTRKL